MTLAKLPGSRADRAAFGQKHLLGKGLTFVHQMGMRSLSNMLWAIGKLRVDLAQDGTGPYLADAIDERVRKLVCAVGKEDGMHVEQLLYGLEFSQYPWSQDLQVLLVEHTVPVFREWDLKAQGEVRGKAATYFARVFVRRCETFSPDHMIDAQDKITLVLASTLQYSG